MANFSDTHAGFPGLITGKSPRLGAAASGWIGAAMSVEANRMSLAVRWKGC